MSIQTNKEEELKYLELLEALEGKIKYNKFNSRFPAKGRFSRDKYPKHMMFMEAGKNFFQRLLAGANRSGKTDTGAYETTAHLTGDYPDYWPGHRFLNPIRGWAVGISISVVKEVMQEALLGPLNDIGSGMIPKDKIVGYTRKAGVSGAVDMVRVKHKSGGISELIFKSYEQGRLDFQGTKKDWIWLDEEPTDIGIYEECLMRLMDDVSPGHIIITFTPLLGLTKLVLSFLSGGRFSENGINPDDPAKFAVQVTWDDIPHLNKEQKEIMIKSISPHLRDARTKGIPHLGAGAIFPYSEEEIIIKPRPIPSYWPKGYGLDVGWHKTAAAWIALDPDSNIYYIYSEHYRGQAEIPIHVDAIKARGGWMDGVIDTAALRHNEMDGQVIFDQYVDGGLNLVKANKAVEGGILKMCQLFASGRLKVFDTCTNWIEEFRTYRRDENGKVATKQNDHLMDATRYIIMSCPDILRLEPDPDDYQLNNFSKNNRDSLTGY